MFLERSLNASSQVYEEVCNGRQDLCHLRFDEVTLLGSHNSMAHHHFQASIEMSLCQDDAIHCTSTYSKLNLQTIVLDMFDAKPN